VHFSALFSFVAIGRVSTVKISSLGGALYSTQSLTGH